MIFFELYPAYKISDPNMQTVPDLKHITAEYLAEQLPSECLDALVLASVNSRSVFMELQSGQVRFHPVLAVCSQNATCQGLHHLKVVLEAPVTDTLYAIVSDSVKFVCTSMERLMQELRAHYKRNAVIFTVCVYKLQCDEFVLDHSLPAKNLLQ